MRKMKKSKKKQEILFLFLTITDVLSLNFQNSDEYWIPQQNIHHKIDKLIFL